MATVPRASDVPQAPPTMIGAALRTPGGSVGAVLVVLVVLMALFAPWLAPYDPLAQNLTPQTVLKGPNTANWLGTDLLGRDVLSRTLHGLRFSLAITLFGGGIAVLSGLTLGTLAGSLGGWWDRGIMRLMDACLAFPLLVLAIAVAVAFGRGAIGAVTAIAFVNLPVFTRLVRGQMLRLNRSDYMLAAIVMGAGTFWRIRRHAIPNLINPVIVQATVALSFGVLIESGLSFLGLGLQPPAPSLGLMIADAKAYMPVAPHLVFVPSAAIFATVLGFNLLGDALSDALGRTA